MCGVPPLSLAEMVIRIDRPSWTVELAGRIDGPLAEKLTRTSVRGVSLRTKKDDPWAVVLTISSAT